VGGAKNEVVILNLDRFSEKPTGYVLPLDEVFITLKESPGVKLALMRSRIIARRSPCLSWLAISSQTNCAKERRWRRTVA